MRENVISSTEELVEINAIFRKKNFQPDKFGLTH